MLANKEELEPRYRNHNLVNDKYYKECSECHIEPDWLLVYQYHDDELLLLLMNTGSHSEVFGKQLSLFFFEREISVKLLAVGLYSFTKVPF